MKLRNKLSRVDGGGRGWGWGWMDGWMDGGGWLDYVKLRLAKASQLSWSWGLAWLSLAIVATNYVANQPPSNGPACAKSFSSVPRFYNYFCR